MSRVLWGAVPAHNLPRLMDFLSQRHFLISFITCWIFSIDLCKFLLDVPYSLL